MSLFQFEWKKMHQSKLPYYFLILTLLFITFLFIRNHSQQMQIVNEQVTYFSKFASDIRMELETDREMLKAGQNPELEEKTIAGSVVYAKLNELIYNLKNGKQLDALQSEISVYDTASVYQKKEGTFALSPEDMEAEKALNKELIAVQLPKEDVHRSITPALFTYSIASYMLSGIGILFVLLMVLGFVTREYEEKSIRLQYTLPVSRSRHMVAKLGAFLSFGVTWLVAGITYAYILARLFGMPREGQFQYPLRPNEEGWTTVQDMLQWFSWAGVLGMISILVIGWSVATSFRSTIVSYLSVLVLVGGGSYLAQLGSAKWNPIQIFDTPGNLLAQDASAMRITLLAVSVMGVLLIGTIHWNKRRSV